ncbi:MAG: site-specific DNA-methyltransferase [Ignavibacteria bacterium]|nr:site-specific DNA-methyltransferase [Ignavibacteria bacterium]
MTTGKNTGNTCFILHGDSRKKLSFLKESVDLIVTSPPYADARKKHYDSIPPDDFSDWLSSFHEAFWQALKPDGSLVINIKDKVVDGVRCHFVWKTIEELTQRGWYCIEDYIWHKTNPMPGFWPTRLRDGWEYCFHLSKTKRPYMNQDAVRVPIGEWVKTRLQKLGKNDKQRHNSSNESGFGRDLSRWVDQETVLPSNVLSIPLVGKNMGHPAVFPIELPEFFIKLLSRPGSLVVDPFGGSGTTGIAALQNDRDCVLIDTDLDYCKVAMQRLNKENLSKKHKIVFEETPVVYSKKEEAKVASQLLLALREQHALYFSKKKSVGVSLSL